MASFSFITPSGEVHTTTFAEDDEKKLLQGVKDLLNKVSKIGFLLMWSQHKRVSICQCYPKDLLCNGIKPPKILPSLGTKPWDLKAVDTKELWQFGSFNSPASLDLMCVAIRRTKS